MTYENWLAFLLASIVITLIPGPSVLLVISLALAKGKRAAFICILGDVIGTILLISFSYFGLGAILSSSMFLFQTVKWAGIAYLAYLGYAQIAGARNDDITPLEQNAGSSNWRSFWVGSITAVLNPKAIIFYMAFLAQFISPEGNMLLQLGILMITSLVVIVVLLSLYAFAAAQTRIMFTKPETRKKFGFLGGGIMIAGSALMAVTR